MNKSIVTLQFGNYSNFIGAHWWNIQLGDFQEASFVYNSDVPPEIDNDILYREGENLRKETTYTPRLLLVDLKRNMASLSLRSDLYEENFFPDIDNDDFWPSNKIEIIRQPEHEKNEFIKDLEKREKEMDVDGSPDEEDLVKRYAPRYELDDKVKYWPDYLGVKFHPRSLTTLNEETFSTYSQGVALWRTKLFTEEWTDKCSAYVEECDCLEGFQILFDCADGFSGLSYSALTYLQEEYAKKCIFALPSITPSYPEDAPNCTGLVNTILSLSDLSEVSDAFVPLCTDANGGLDLVCPRQFSNLRYNNELAYHSSAILAAYMDTISLNYRQRKNLRQLSSLLQELTPCGRKLLSGTMRLPFPMYAGFSVLESLEKLEEPYWTNVTPRTNVSVESAFKQQITVRGLSSFALLPSFEKRTDNPAYTCQSVTELFSMYFDYCSLTSKKGRFFVNSFESRLKIPESFPNIFCDEVTRIGCVSLEPMFIKTAVVETPMLAGLHNCPSVSLYLSDLCNQASKVKYSSLHQFSSAGLEQQEYAESIEKLLTLKDDYQ